MKMAAVHIIAGLAKPRYARGEQTMVRILPRKIFPPQFRRERMNRGWGVYAKMGYSVKKILWWLVNGVVFVMVFAVVWLASVDKTDLQNAFTPATLFFVVVTILVAVAQLHS
ncbi:serine/threonine protein kinase [Colletotrichum plurivorum]|uniref:Serine/threonine protein kinase n=1 Tax=Colletotrichum plurivorum TaxID=2175906 RepID=A0A8H6JW76_9PEZI|nr:serine/threonine protein kinase [Colletotrichum plurivorum]